MDRQLRSPQNTKSPRRIACIRCRTRKKRCDHAVPTCGECRRSGSECVQYGTKTSGSFTTVPVAYLRQLERQLANGQRSVGATATEPDDSRFDNDGDSMDGVSDYPSPFGTGAGGYLGSDHQAGAGDDSSPMPSGAPRFDQTHPENEMSDTRHHAASDVRPLGRNPETLGLGSSRDGLLSIGEDWLDHYASTYFGHVQPQWHFLDEGSWRESYGAWKGGSSEAAPCHVFMLQLVLAVGASVASSFRSGCPHLMHASKLHEQAMRTNLVHVTGHPSALLRTQASLLILLHAFHGPSPEAVPGSILLVLMNCTNLIKDVEGHAPHDDDLCNDFDGTKRLTIMTSHILNEVVASAWSFQHSFMFDVLDETMFECVSKLSAARKETGFYGHLFQLRCIQSKIRHFNKKLQKLEPTDPFRETCRLRLKDELQVWKERIGFVTDSSPKDNLVYHEPGSLSKLYDYSLSILMQERPCMSGSEEVGQLVECCSEACRTFMSSQQSDSVIYRTWTALMYQYRLGIILLYCYSMTPPLLRTASFTAPETLAGLDCCRKTLEKFAARWPRALVFVRSYQLLAESVFDGPAFGQACDASLLESPSSQSLCSPYALEGERKIQMQCYITELRMQHVHQAVISLMEEMVYRPRPQDLNYEGLDFLPAMSMAGFDLFNF